jgi:hypothetical protein
MKKSQLILLLVLGFIGFAYFGGFVNKRKMIGETWDKLIPSIKEKVLATLAQAEAEGLSVMFFEGWRSPEDEQADIDKGTSHLTDPYNGHHVWGAAADIVFMNYLGFASWPDASDPRWQQLIDIGISKGLNHPISWDKPHFEDPSFNLSIARAQYGNDYEQYIKNNGGLA